MPDIIKTVGLIKKYGNKVTAVNGLDLTVGEGELFALLGVNGAGKTTTVKMLTCLTAPTDGDAYLDGLSIRKDADKVKKIIGVSPQESAVAPNLTVKENLSLMCKLYGIGKTEREEKISSLSDSLGLSDFMSKRAGRLSGGQMRRLSIAMALTGNSKILFLDEPTLGLDVISRSELWKLMRQLKGKITIVLTTHYMEEAEELSDRIGIMKDGRLLAVGISGELKRLVGANSLEKAFISIVQGGGAI